MFLLILAPSWCLSKSLKQSLPWSRELSVLSVNCSVQWEVPVPLGAVSVTLSPENKQEVQRELRGHLAAESICTLASNQGARRDGSTRARMHAHARSCWPGGGCEVGGMPPSCITKQEHTGGLSCARQGNVVKSPSRSPDSNTVCCPQWTQVIGTSPWAGLTHSKFCKWLDKLSTKAHTLSLQYSSG